MTTDGASTQSCWTQAAFWVTRLSLIPLIKEVTSSGVCAEKVRHITTYAFQLSKLVFVWNETKKVILRGHKEKTTGLTITSKQPEKDGGCTQTVWLLTILQ